jgi:hypothetical protein
MFGLDSLLSNEHKCVANSESAVLPDPHQRLRDPFRPFLIIKPYFPDIFGKKPCYWLGILRLIFRCYFKGCVSNEK